MQSVMTPQHNFATVPNAEISRSVFNRSHGYKTTLDAANIVPIYVDEALPGDTHKLSVSAFARLATPIKPVMDNMYMDFFFFSVPIRLIWDNFRKFMGEQDNPGDSIAYTVPTVDINGVTEGTLWDYFGLPTKTTTTTNVSALWSRAYNLIYNEWFRDQNLQDSITVDVDDGPDTASDYVIKKRGKRHDYFTSALPWPQKGDAIELPLGTKAPVATDAAGVTTELDIYSSVNSAYRMLQTYNGNNQIVYSTTAGAEGDSLYADLSSATAASINEIRQAFQLQKLIERDARGGTRYIEKVKAHFGVTSPDLRAIRPVYLGGGTVPIRINPVATTAAYSASQGADLSGFGVAAGDGIGFNASFTEHCVLLGLVSIRADLTYQQGIDKMFLRSTQYDYFWPALQHIGEQTIENQEIYFDSGTPANNTLVFGYQERYAEYRYKPSKITGLFRANATGTLEVWHLSDDFSSLPSLNSTFIEDSAATVIDRAIVTPTEPQFLYDSFVNLKSVRPMPVYGVPGLMDRF